MKKDLRFTRVGQGGISGNRQEEEDKQLQLGKILGKHFGTLCQLKIRKNLREIGEREREREREKARK